MVQNQGKRQFKFVAAGLIVVATVLWLAYSAASETNAKDYYVTISELQNMGQKAYKRHLRVAGNVQPGSINRAGTNATFSLLEQLCPKGSGPPPHTHSQTENFGGRNVAA